MKGFIYLLNSDHGIKIGRTKSPSTRLRHFGVKLPFKTQLLACFPVTDCIAAEAYYHQRHAADRLEGEWFSTNILAISEEPKWRTLGWRYWSITPGDEARSEFEAAREWIEKDRCHPDFRTSFLSEQWYSEAMQEQIEAEAALAKYPTENALDEAVAACMWRQARRLELVESELSQLFPQAELASEVLSVLEKVRHVSAYWSAKAMGIAYRDPEDRGSWPNARELRLAMDYDQRHHRRLQEQACDDIDFDDIDFT